MPEASNVEGCLQLWELREHYCYGDEYISQCFATRCIAWEKAGTNCRVVGRSDALTQMHCSSQGMPLARTMPASTCMRCHDTVDTHDSVPGYGVARKKLQLREIGHG